MYRTYVPCSVKRTWHNVRCTLHCDPHHPRSAPCHAEPVGVVGAHSAVRRPSIEQLGVRTGPGKVDGAARLVGIVNAIDEEKVTADVAFAVARP